VKTLYDDAIAQDIEMLPPDVNASAYRFEPVDATRIRYGLGGVKGTGEQAIDAIVEARASGGTFSDLFDFCRRVDKRLVNRRVVEALIRAGAFDTVDISRAKLYAAAGLALEAGERAAATASQVSLFGEETAPALPANMNVREWPESERLVHEKAALGFYLSGHPFHAYAAELASIVRTSLSNLQPKNEHVLVAGIVTALRVQSSRRGKMAFVTLDDGYGRVEVMVYNEAFDHARALLREDQLVVMNIRVSPRMSDDGEMQGLRIIADDVFDLTTLRKRFGRRLRIACNGNASADRLEDILSPFRAGTMPVTVHYCNERHRGDADLPEAWQVTPDEALIERLREWLAPENVQVLYA
jgi:DNA polymerase-3 subunit alpha